ncbi:MAG: hypothetical protein EHM16_06870 [Betaproteobacteria bacterium]|nr:MAG: hypothetical protein EHM16_06870 [Betaproteobacteria bacterium]
MSCCGSRGTSRAAAGRLPAAAAEDARRRPAPGTNPADRASGIHAGAAATGGPNPGGSIRTVYPRMTRVPFQASSISR